MPPAAPGGPADASAAHPSPPSPSSAAAADPPFLLLAKVDWAAYPALSEGHVNPMNLVGRRPGSVIIEMDTQWFLRRGVPACACLSPLLTWRRRRRFATDAGKETVKSVDSLRQCVVFGTGLALASSLAYSLGTDVTRRRFKTMDEVVDEALFVALDDDAHRWARTTGAFQFIGSVWAVLGGTTSLPARAAFGWGLGTVAAAPFSWSALDKSLDYLFRR